MQKDLFLTVSAILFMANSAFGMEKEVLLETPISAIGQLSIVDEKERILVDSQDLSMTFPEKSGEPPVKRKVSKTLPIDCCRRKSSESPRNGKIISPRLSVSPNQNKPILEDKRHCTRAGEDSLSLSSEEKIESLGCLPILSSEEKKDSSEHSPIISQEKQGVLLDHSHLLIPSLQEEKVFGYNQPPQRFRRYSLDGPLKKDAISNISQGEEKSSNFSQG